MARKLGKRKVVIMGAAGRDFHNFNTYFRDNPNFEVVAFTATQIPDIEGRTYPPELAGKYYPDGIPILPEADLPKIIKEKEVDEVYFSYSDVSNQYVMERAAIAMSAGASFHLLGPGDTMLRSKKPVIAVCAVRTGCGKSQTTRKVAEILKSMGKKVAVIRHPMPYGDLRKQIWQRFATYEDLDKYECTIEEREEYEPHIDRGNVVYAGVDYGEILARA
ncbi:GTPase, partial [bacterium]|nr:GTPase [bacterium]